LGTLVAAGIISVDSVVFMWMNVAECIVIIGLTLFLSETKGVELIDKIDDDDAEQKCIET
jgi:hypothetical protein